MNSEEREELLDQFLEKFSVEKLKEMTLDEYVIGTGNQDCFCNWVENKLEDFGEIGGPRGSYIYEIFVKDGSREKPYSMKEFQQDAKYVWWGKHGADVNGAFENIKEKILQVVDCAQKGNLDAIVDIDFFDHLFKWKIAFLYTPRESEKRFIPIYARTWLEWLIKNEGMECEKNLPRSKLYEKIMGARNDKEFWSFYDDLCQKYHEAHPKVKKQNLVDEEGDVMSTGKIVEPCFDLLSRNRNIILHGAPGTGKTFAAKKIAARLIFGEKFPENFEAEEKFKGQCGFVQFHPSYDYTDFVEGVRPCSAEGEKGVVSGFVRQDGIFKHFCKNAIWQVQTKEAGADKLAEFKINTQPTVWKVSLMGTGVNEIRTDCLKNGYIRIGWKEYGNVADFSDFNGYTDVGGKAVLCAFQNGMKEGDLVVSCFSSKETDAIGVIEGDYEYKEDGGDFPRYRKVRWLVKNIKEDIVKINNNKQMTLSTVYKLGITTGDVLEIVKKYNDKNKKSEKSSQEETSDMNYVFIIDEINRGEASKIFGELFFSIDPGYRGIKGKVKTQYQNLVDNGDTFKDGFYVPENVYIIGTMNDIDRSVESMDFAFRRRFAWYEVTAEATQTMLDSLKDQGIREDVIEEAKAKMNALNKLIADTPDLGESYQIGAAYFMKLKEYGGGFTQLWDYHLKGLLTDYLRGLDSANETLTKFKNAYDEASVNG